MNSSAAEPQGPIRTPLPNPLPFGRGEGEATPRSLSALIQRQCSPAEGERGKAVSSFRLWTKRFHLRGLESERGRE